MDVVQTPQLVFSYSNNAYTGQETFSFTYDNVNSQVTLFQENSFGTGFGGGGSSLLFDKTKTDIGFSFTNKTVTLPESNFTI